MLVAFTDASGTPVPESLRSAYQDVVREALTTLRPADEDWSVTMMAESAATMRLEFARSTDAPRSFSFASDGDDEERSQLLRLVCQFVWTYWPKEKAVS
jgi:hypothetical protein